MAEVSQRPRAARARARRNGKASTKRSADLQRDIAILYKPISEWDWKELSKGRPRCEDGTFRGRRPDWITPALEREIQNRMKTMTEEEVMSHAKDAIDTLTQLMQDDDVDITGKPVVPASVRADCAKYIINRVLGTPTTKAEISGDPAYVHLMGKIMVNPDGDNAHPVVEGEVVDIDGEEEDGGE